MKRFLIQLIIFSSPLIVLFGLPTFFLWQSKENFYKIENLLSEKGKYLIGYAYHENNYGFIKWSFLNSNESKKVWALGSSRVLQFRENMFDSSFYNAGYTISSIADFKPFIESLPQNKRPRYLVVGLDQWMFNASFDSLKTRPLPESWQKSFTFYPQIFPSYKTFYGDFFDHKFTFNGLLENSDSCKKIGLNAKMHNTGFRNDGSMYYGEQISKLILKDTTASDYNYSNTFDRIAKGERRFQYCKSVNENALTELDNFLGYCKHQNIIVIAFLPPYADRVYSKMMASGDYEYLRDIYSRIKPYFQKYNYEVYDFSKVSDFNSSDNETIDGFHGGELCYQKLLISMLDSGSKLNEVTNVARLRKDVQNKKNNYAIYEN